MSPMIQVSTDLYVALRMLKKQGDYTIADVIWRLVEQHGYPRTDAATWSWVIGPAEGLLSRGGTLPNGLRLRMRYKRRPYFYADVQEGQIWLDGTPYDSPSAAAAAVAKRSGAYGSYPKVDGWKYWDYEFPQGTEQWYSIDMLR